MTAHQWAEIVLLIGGSVAGRFVPAN